MATVEQKIATERRARELLAEQGLPEPTVIEYGHTCIRLIWVQSRLALRIDIDDEGSGEEVILIDRPHASQPPLTGDRDDDAIAVLGVEICDN